MVFFLLQVLTKSLLNVNVDNTPECLNTYDFHRNVGIKQHGSRKCLTVHVGLRIDMPKIAAISLFY